MKLPVWRINFPFYENLEYYLDDRGNENSTKRQISLLRDKKYISVNRILIVDSI
ncbi:hypothetical protein [Methanosarcina horonobensis]|uniref:hypothetical protein n=1 Tax=Methanosarcina horonobensis TaxID=418008 RepID=UPI000AFBFF9C|nr:hypothetical protein [Methanosarcina horonobensis]